MLADKALGISGLVQQLQLGKLAQDRPDFRTLDPGPKEYCNGQLVKMHGSVSPVMQRIRSIDFSMEFFISLAIIRQIYRQTTLSWPRVKSIRVQPPA